MSEVPATTAGAVVQWAPPPVGAPEADLVAWANALPMSRVLAIECLSLNRQLATFTVATMPLPPNPNGSVHGGIVSAIADHCLGILSVANAPRDRLSVTSSLHGQFHRPAVPPLMIRSELISAGSRLIFVELKMDDPRGRRCATFQATMVVGGADRRA